MRIAWGAGWDRSDVGTSRAVCPPGVMGPTAEVQIIRRLCPMWHESREWRERHSWPAAELVTEHGLH